MQNHSTEDTIAAISTPPGEGGIGIVRLSGPMAVRIAEALFVSSRGRSLCGSTRQRVFHGHIVSSEGKILDEVLVHVMRRPHSYTTEDVVEINAHGGFAPLQAILAETLKQGARLARPGEFTLRAFLNGRLDLTRAEAVVDLIRARTQTALQAANAAAQGLLTQEMRKIQDILTQALARVEAAADFPEEDLPDLVDDALIHQLTQTRQAMIQLIQGADTGIRIREGLQVAIVGKPNVGKSSLFNALLKDARAIVSEEPGTTRDRIEETLSLGGIPVRLTDTAGIRETSSRVEAIGVQIAERVAGYADYVLFVVDGSKPVTEEDKRLAHWLVDQDSAVILVRNKKDLFSNSIQPWRPKEFHLKFKAMYDVSATTGEGLAELEAGLAKLFAGTAFVETTTPMLFRMHQKESMQRAAASLDRFLADPMASPELTAIELREALTALGEITGETTPEDILDRIFSEFCIGK